ncbi:MAG: SemiSWEET transporter [Porticoccaceae bacterium]|nr:SemiSWEET transporter [Porticoccaceae bacterium]
MGDTIGYVAACLTTLSFLPQAILTLRTRKTDEISFWMYLLFSLGVACWLGYGLVLHNGAIIAANAVTLLLALPILAIKIHNLINRRD